MLPLYLVYQCYLSTLSTCAGAESLVTRIVHILADKERESRERERARERARAEREGTVQLQLQGGTGRERAPFSAQLLTLVKQLYLTRLQDVRLLLPVLPALVCTPFVH